MTEEAPAEAAGAYVHVPFCARRCGYCGFYSEVRPTPSGFGEGLIREAELALAGNLLPGGGDVAFSRFDTLYVGGGTPSVVSAERLGRWVEALRRVLQLPTSAEVTVELNPDDVSEHLVGRLLEAGVTRVSLGVQSFTDRALRWMGRRHSAEQARAAIGRLRSRSRWRLSVDLIYGWPGQRSAEWKRDLQEAVDRGVDHVSAYALTVEPFTPYARRVLRGEEKPARDETLARRFEEAGAFLGQLRWTQYEVSNFARTPGERSRHNMKYWRHVDYLGLGPSAHSLLGRWRWWNTRGVDHYLDAVARGAPPRSGAEHLDPEQWWLEELMLGFRTVEGVGEELLLGRAENRAVLEALCDEGLLVRRNGRVVPTQRGLLMADGLPLRFERAM